jgi:hypothetical protein
MSMHMRRLLVWGSVAAGMSAADPAAAGFSQVYQATGHLGLEITGAASLNPPGTGSVTLSSSTLGAVIQKAYFYTTQVNNTLGMQGTFGGAPLQPAVAGPHASDAQLITLSTYRWDVTPVIVPGLNTYSFSLLDASNGPVTPAGVGLAVIWSGASEPLRTVTLVDGVQQVGESGAETESLTFTGLPAGSTTVWVFTTDDDASLGETVVYNSSNIGGPLVGNLGLNASVLQMSGTSVSGANTLSISTLADHLTWVLGATAVTLPPVGVQPSSWSRLKAGYR